MRPRMTAGVAVAVFALALVTVQSIPAAGAVTTDVFTPAADTFVIATNASKNFGATTTLKVDVKPDTRGYLRFQVDVSAPVVDATLRLYSPAGSSVGVSVRPVADVTWGELAVTYSNAPAFGAPIAATGRMNAGWTSVDVSQLVTGPGPVSLALTTATSTTIKVNSRQSGATAPQLLVRTSSTDDVEDPSTPGGLSVSATGPTHALVTWTASTDDVAVIGYDVFRDGQLVGSVDADVSTFADAGLEAEQTYEYGVEAFDAAGNRSPRAGPVSVTTPGASVDPVVVAVGDIACDPAAKAFVGGLGTATECQQMATSDLALSLDPTAVLALGDLQYACGGYSAFLQSYDPSWGRLRSITHPVPGNHEYGTTSTHPTGTGCSAASDASGYFAYFGAAAGDPTKGWYSFDLGAWHVVALNSNCNRIGGCGLTSPQALWLQADLAASDARCTLALMHFPRFSSGPHGGYTSVDKLWQLLRADEAEIALAGHDHLYERFARLDVLQQPDPLGIRSFVVGTGGKERYAVTTVQPGSEVRIDDRYGVLELTLSDGSYAWRFVPLGGGPALDAGAETCH